MSDRRVRARSIVFVVAALCVGGCGGSGSSGGGAGAAAGSGATAGAGGSGASAGTGGTGGSGASAGTGGTGGSGASAGTGGTGGSGASAGTGGTGGSMSVDEFLAAYQKALCEDAGSCCAAYGAAADPQQCNDLYATLISRVTDGIANGGVVFDSSVAPECLATLKQSVAACDLENLDTAPCEAVLVGTVQPGDACVSDVECVRPTKGSVDCDQGVCVQEPAGTVGSSCGATCVEQSSFTLCLHNGTGDARCYTNDGLFCNEATSTCQSLLAVGASGCTSGFDCVDGAYCDSGTCAPDRTLGETCTGQACDPDTAFCDNGQCVAKLADGQPCTSSSECAGGACRNSVCAQAFPGLLGLACG